MNAHFFGGSFLPFYRFGVYLVFTARFSAFLWPLCTAEIHFGEYKQEGPTAITYRGRPLTKSACWHRINIKGGTTERRLPPQCDRSKTVSLRGWAVLLLFYGREYQTNNADYHKAELE